MKEYISTGGKGGTISSLLQQFSKLNNAETTVEKTCADRIIYDQQVVTQVTQLFDGNATPDRTNMKSSYTSNNSEHMLVMGFRLFQAIGATLDENAWQPGISDAVLKNANIDVTINGQRVLSKTPLTAFDNNALSATVAGATDDNRGFYFLMEPVFWPGQTEIEANITINSGKTITTNLAVRMELHGIGFIGN